MIYPPTDLIKKDFKLNLAHITDKDGNVFQVVNEVPTEDGVEIVVDLEATAKELNAHAESRKFINRVKSLFTARE